MGATEIVTAWVRYLKDEVLAGLPAALVKALAVFSLAVLEAQRCQSGRVAVRIRSAGKFASRRRRWERWLANPRFDPQAVQRHLARAVWQRWSGPLQRPALVLLDETARGRALKCLKVSLAYRHRALPLASACYAYRRPPPGGMARLVRRLLDRATADAPPGTAVVVLADRGLAWPAVVDHCARRGWHYLLRLQGQTQARLSDGRVVAARDLAPQAGADPWSGAAEVFKKAGWRRANLVATWAKGAREPWLLVTDQSACAGRWRQYAKRMWIEEAFRDDKSHGFGWQQSRVDDPRHASRLQTVLALAMLLALSLGTWLIKRGYRHWLDPRRRRRLSVFHLGLLGVACLLADPALKWGLYLYFHPS